MAFFRRQKQYIPFHADLKTPLLKIGRDLFRLDDAARGVLVTGGSGSGKTSGSGKALAMAYLKAGMGGLVLCAKVDEARTWRGYAEAAGRADDVIEINASSEARFNFLDYALATVAKPRFEHNLLAVMDSVIEAVGASGGEGGENQFFYTNAREMVSHVLPILVAVYGRLRMRDIVAFIDHAATTQEQLDNPEWCADSYTARTLAAASLLIEEDEDLAIHCEYWFTRFLNWSDRTRSSVVSTFTSTVYEFLTGAMNRMFCTDTTFVPEMSHHGAILIVNLPVKEYGKMGEAMQKIIKFLWQLSVEARVPPSQTWWQRMTVPEPPIRPVFLFADECQFFVTERDDDFFSTARSARACGVYMTQDLPSFYSRLPKDGEHGADALIGKFQTRVIHGNLNAPTNEAAAKLIGHVAKQQLSQQQNANQNRGEGGAYQPHDVAQSDNSGRGISSSTTISTYRDYAVPPEYFTNQLRNGTRENRFKVDAIMVTTGRTWRHSRMNFTKAAFDQRK